MEPENSSTSGCQSRKCGCILQGANKKPTRFSMTQAQVLSVPSVSLIEGRPATTSLDIAEHFDKRHDDVIKSIRNLSLYLPGRIQRPQFCRG